MKGQDRKQTIKKKKGLGEPAHEHYKILKKQNNSRNQSQQNLIITKCENNIFEIVLRYIL